MGKEGTIKRALYVAKQRRGYQDGGSPADFSDPRYADMYYSGLPLTGVGGILKQFFPDPTKTGAYDAYMKQKSAEYAPKPSVGKTPDFNSTPIQPGTGSSLASMPQFNSQSLGKIPTMQDWAAFNPFQRQAPSSIPPLSQHQFYNGAGAPVYPTKTASAAAPMGETGGAGSSPSIKGDRAYGPIGSESGGSGSSSSGSFGSQDSGPISSSTSYDNTTNVSQAIESSPLDAPTADTSWAGSLQGARDAFAGPNVGPTAFAEGLTASMPGVGPYGDLSGARSAFAAQQSDEEAAAAEAEAASSAGPEGTSEGSYSGNYGGGWGDDSDNQSGDTGGGDDSGGWGGGDDSGGWGGGDDSGDSGGGGDGGDGGGDGGGGGGDGGGGEKRGGRIYPLRHHTDWEEAHDYEKSGGKLVHMSPDQYLKRVKHLDMDDHDEHLIHHFTKQMENGEKFDPLAIYPDNHPNGRHRAHAAKKLGIKKVPVVTWPKEKSVKRKSGGPVVDQALMLTSKKAASRRGRPD
jgi:hypothetical protein